MRAITVRTTPAEKAFMAASGTAPEDLIHFCGGCRVALSDPQKAATVMRGLCKLMLSAQPTPVSDRIADRYARFILDRTKPAEPTPPRKP